MRNLIRKIILEEFKKALIETQTGTLNVKRPDSDYSSLSSRYYGSDYEDAEELIDIEGGVSVSPGERYAASLAQAPRGSLRDFFIAVMDELGVTPTEEKLKFFGAWASLERPRTSNNPLATTHPGKGRNTWSGDPNMSRFNYAGVKNYSSFERGVDATVTTITNGYYPDIVAYLSDSLIQPPLVEPISSAIDALSHAGVRKNLDKWGSKGWKVHKMLVRGSTDQDRTIITEPGSVLTEATCRRLVEKQSGTLSVKSTDSDYHSLSSRFSSSDDGGEEIISGNFVADIPPGTTIAFPVGILPGESKPARTSGAGVRTSPDTGDGKTGTSNHHGVDYGVVVGTPIVAYADGKVTSVGSGGNSGKMMSVSHPNLGSWTDGKKSGSVTTQYMHLNRFLKEEGAEVQAGEVIALSGNTGNSSGPHLHFTFKIGGSQSNNDALYKSKLDNATLIPVRNIEDEPAVASADDNDKGEKDVEVVAKVDVDSTDTSSDALSGQADDIKAAMDG